MQAMTHTVGRKPRTEFILDPVEALRTGHLIDGMLAHAVPAMARGVLRASHQAMNRLDDERHLQAARRLNSRSKTPSANQAMNPDALQKLKKLL